ncbi:MAG: MATE family efflux transporter, partial [Firmicutes bacterium]|nr:MATE family efflux transporter [Bacillota bacterium]
VARCYGTGQKTEKLSNAVHTAIFVAITGGAIFAVLGFSVSGLLLRLIAVPADILPLSRLYMRIYFLGLPFNMLYNYGTAILRARGDTTRPLVYLTISGTTNVILNLIFVIVFKMDVAGVALATDISNCLSAFLILRFLVRSDDELHVDLRKIRPDKEAFIAMTRIGVPAGVQNSLFSIANAVIQTAINAYGPIIMAGSSAAVSICQFVYVSMNSFSQAGQTFTSQNIAAGKQERISGIVRTCLLCNTIVGGALCLFEFVFCRQLLTLYNTSPEVIAAGMQRIRLFVVTYLIYGYADVFVGVIRGNGISLQTVIINLIATCVLRIVYIGFLDVPAVSPVMVYAAYPISWAVFMLAVAAYWLHVKRTFDYQNIRR